MIGLPRSTYHYKHKERGRPVSDADLIAAMIAIKGEFPLYGSPRVTHELGRRGCKANHKRVERLMKANDLNVKSRRRFVRTTNSDHPYPIYPNLYRNVIPAKVDVVWVADITYIALEDDRFAYAAVILDACSRKVVGYAISKRIDAKLADVALKRLEVDGDGLDLLDRRYLHALVDMYGGGPVGVDTLAAALAEARDAIEDVIEPYLMQQGFVMRTPRGRVAAPKAYERLGKKAPSSPPPASGSLFGEK